MRGPPFFPEHSVAGEAAKRRNGRARGTSPEADGRRTRRRKRRRTGGGAAAQETAAGRAKATTPAGRFPPGPRSIPSASSIAHHSPPPLRGTGRARCAASCDDAQIPRGPPPGGHAAARQGIPRKTDGYHRRVHFRGRVEAAPADGELPRVSASTDSRPRGSRTPSLPAGRTAAPPSPSGASGPPAGSAPGDRSAAGPRGGDGVRQVPHHRPPRGKRRFHSSSGTERKSASSTSTGLPQTPRGGGPPARGPPRRRRPRPRFGQRPGQRPQPGADLQVRRGQERASRRSSGRCCRRGGSSGRTTSGGRAPAPPASSSDGQRENREAA
jgi:hypothetical protein